MNKARRHELKMLKYKRRLKNLRIKDDSEGNFYSLRSTGNPCSCMACQQGKYERAKGKSKLPKLIDFELNYYSGELEFDFSKGIFVESIEDEKANAEAKELILNWDNLKTA